MKMITDKAWMRRGFTLLWDVDLLGEVAPPNEIISLRQFYTLANAWPSELPSFGGYALVVSGLEGSLDALSDDESDLWLQEHLRPAVLDFQDEYEGQAALMFWLPSGGSRLKMHRATEEYYWKRSASNISLGRCLWAGAESDVERILTPDSPNADPDGPAWCGLHHPRIS